LAQPWISVYFSVSSASENATLSCSSAASGALLGAVGAFVERELNEGWLLLAAFLAVSALVVVSYTTTAARGELGITTEVTALLAFIVGALCGWDKVGVASVATMVCLLLLTLKDYLHRLA
jgi:uncharacterized membrane protein (DUF4010 family)